MRILVAIAFACCLLLPSAIAAGRAEADIVWEDDKAFVEVSVTGAVPEGVEGLKGPVRFYNAKGELLWPGHRETAEIEVPLTGPGPYTGRVELQHLADPKQQHRVDLELRHSGLELDYQETLYFNPPGQQLRTWGLLRQYAFPAHKVYYRVGLAAFRGKDLREIPVVLRLTDADANEIMSTTEVIQPAHKPRIHYLDVSPTAERAMGPYRLDVEIESDLYSLWFSTSETFPYAHAMPGRSAPFRSIPMRRAGFAATSGIRRDSGSPRRWWPSSPGMSCGSGAPPSPSQRTSSLGLASRPARRPFT